jgi:hypothetical protein
MRSLIVFSLFLVTALSCSNQSSPTTLTTITNSYGGNMPTITSQTEHHYFVDYQQPLSIFVVAEGVGSLSYQWRVLNEEGSFVNIPGATSSVFSKTSAEREDNSVMYYCVVNDTRGSVRSGYIITIVDKVPPIIIVQPEDVTVNVGEMLEICADASGSTPLSPVWKKNGVEIPNETSSCIFIESAQFSDTGSYVCEISNDYGTVTSSTAVVKVVGIVQDLPLNDVSGSDAVATTGINATYTANCLLNQPGKFGPCVKMGSTSSFIEIPYNESMVVTDNINDKPFSLGIWFKQDALTTIAYTLCRKGRIVLNNQEFVLTIEGPAQLKFKLTNTNASQYLLITAPSLTDTDWHHVVATYNGDKTVNGMNLYLDGELVNTNRISSASYTGMTNGLGSTRIGWVINTSMERFFFANKELTQDEVTAIYNQN